MAIDELLQFEGIGKPEKKKSLLTEHDPVALVTSVFAVWAGVVAKQVRSQGCDSTQAQSLLNEATSILLPYKEVLPVDMIDDQYFLPLRTMAPSHRLCAGLFYTALLNLGSTYVACVPEAPHVHFWGFMLQQGILDFALDEPHTMVYCGYFARGGCLVSRGNITDMGIRARGGLFINHGSVIMMGNDAVAGSFINHHTASNLGCAAHGGIYLNYGKTTEGNVNLVDTAKYTYLGLNAEGALLIDPYQGYPFPPETRRKNTCITPPEIEQDKVLADLLEELRLATTSVPVAEISYISGLLFRISMRCRKSETI